MKHPRDLSPTLMGSIVTLRPIQADDQQQFARAAGDLSTFRYFVTEVPKSLSSDGFERYVERLLNDPALFGFTVVSNQSSSVIGSTAYLDIRPKDRHVEIGMTWYSPELRGSGVNPECKLLMLDYAFSELGAIKVTFKCDARNVHSAGAIHKLGAKPEGVFRKHRLNEFGEYRDTAYFSILEEEFPAVRKNLLLRLAAYRDSAEN